ncbi:MAG TPA: TonB-dependent receptor [Thermoanaerobaculia bacterium]|nr:TonB-dependent receptor [Thermoanaerobaculia bacterium]
MALSSSSIAIISLSALLVLPISLPAHDTSAIPPAESIHEQSTANAPEVPAPSPPVTPPLVLFDRLTVTGGPGSVDEIPGSAHYIGKEELQRQSQSDVARVLRTVPGVNIQDEEGYGLRPNIGMRGTGVERSQKITLMEDGVLIAPAPYSAPAAYYFPTIGRMESIEVRKGSSSIRQGPYTTGGALNLISTSVPSDFAAHVNLAAGEDATVRMHASIGDSIGRFGWLIETYQLDTDGFKRLDGGGDTGFELHDYVAKLRYNSPWDARVQQAFELKLGHTTQSGRETYLGISDADFALTPNRRYAASQEDFIDANHEQYQLRHFIQPSASLDVTTTVYRNDFFRNWYKLDSVAGVSVASILDDPETFSTQLAILRGARDDAGSLKLRANRRDYYAQGVQSVVALRRTTTALDHELEIGLRYHQDQEDRFQQDDSWSMIGGRMFLAQEGAPGSNANRIGEASALAFFVQDRMTFGRWSVTPGFRFESIDFTQTDYGRTDARREGTMARVLRNDVRVLIPGIGASYSIAPSLSIFGGVHRGFAPPGPGSDERTRPEESINYESGVRYTGKPMTAQLVAFFNDYENLLGRDTLSSGGGGTGNLFNGGRVEVKGLEASLQSDFRQLTRLPVSLPVRLAYTWTRAVFESSFETSFDDWAPRVEKGDRLPYLPEHQWATGLGVAFDRWSCAVDITYTDSMRTVAGRGATAANERTDSYLLTDLTTSYSILPRLRLFAQVRNLTDETYIAARRPAGVRPGLPRTVLAGVSWDF